MKTKNVDIFLGYVDGIDLFFGADALMDKVNPSSLGSGLREACGISFFGV